MEIELLPLDSSLPRAEGWPPPFWEETLGLVAGGGQDSAWAIAADGELVGVIGASDRGDGAAQVGYGVVATREGRGVATAALLAVVERLRRDGFSGVVGDTFDDHVSSRRVMEKAGMRLVATKREDVDGEERDLVVYELVF